MQMYIFVYWPVRVDVWFLFINVFMHLICLLPFFFFCLISLYKLLFSRQGAYCWVRSHVFPFTYSCVLYEVEQTVWWWIILHVFLFTFCLKWDHSSSFWDVQYHFASHACLLVAFLLLAWPTECSTMFVCGHGSCCCRTLPILHFCWGKIYYHISAEFYNFTRLHIKEQNCRIKTFSHRLDFYCFYFNEAVEEIQQRKNKLKLAKFAFLLLAPCSRKASLKDKVFPSPSKAPIPKGKAQSPGGEEGAEASPSKVTKSWSFNEKNRGPKHAFRARGSTSRQNSEGEGASHHAVTSD